MKVCNDCGIEKPLNEFYSQIRKTGHVYYHPECKQCTSKRSYKWGQDNRDKRLVMQKKGNRTKYAREQQTLLCRTEERKEYMSLYRKEHKEKVNEYSRKKRNNTHDISLKEWDACKLYFNYRCAYCDMTWEYHKENNKQDLHREHVDPFGADDLSNCIPACKHCNSHKHDRLLDDWFSNENTLYSKEKYDKIIKWITDDFKHYFRI